MLSMGRLKTRGRGELYRRFTIRRGFRIYPLSILCVVVVTALRIPSTSWSTSYTWPGWEALASNILLVQNVSQTASVNCVLWSLPFEIQMYALLPALFLWLVNGWSWRRGMALSAMAVLIASSEYLMRPHGFDGEFLITRYFPCFVSGVIAWKVMDRRNAAKWPGWIWVVGLLAIVLLYRGVDALRVYGPGAFNPFAPHGLRQDHGIWWPEFLDLPRDWLFCAGVGALIPMFREVRQKWLKSTSKLIAKYSYGIYLFHVPVFYLFLSKWKTSIVALDLAITVGVLAIVVALAYRLIEDPFIRMGKRLASQPVARAALRAEEARVG